MQLQYYLAAFAAVATMVQAEPIPRAARVQKNNLSRVQRAPIVAQGVQRREEMYNGVGNGAGVNDEEVEKREEMYNGVGNGAGVNDDEVEKREEMYNGVGNGAGVNDDEVEKREEMYNGVGNGAGVNDK